MIEDLPETGPAMHALATRLFPICRSITGAGLRETLRILAEHVPLTVHEVPSGTPAFDWTVPKEWNIREAYIENEAGEHIVNFREHNLHVVGYSVPIDEWMDLETLQAHLYSREDEPDAIPYITSYYEERWGFCLTHTKRLRLVPGRYHAVINSDLHDGHLTYGELVLQGQTDEEVLLSTYVCHPSMANNELSGPIVTTYLVKWLLEAPRRYTYRIVFAPETIGAIVYLSRTVQHLKERTVAGFNLTCCGDERAYSFLPSRGGQSLADRAALHVLKHRHPDFIRYSFLDRGSDERQYCSVGVDLPVVSLMRSKYGTYREYHTSLDDLRLVTPGGLASTLKAYIEVLSLLEKNQKYHVTVQCEPQLGRRGLMRTLGTGAAHATHLMNVLAYADGKADLIEIAETIHAPAWELYDVVARLESAGLLAVAS